MYKVYRRFQPESINKWINDTKIVVISNDKNIYQSLTHAADVGASVRLDPKSEYHVG